MNDYIDRQTAIDAVMALIPSLTTADGSGQFDAEIYRVQELFVDIGQVLNDLPPVETEPVKHGRWIPFERTTEHVVCICTVCGRRVPMPTWYNYCPNCGAKMDEEGKA